MEPVANPLPLTKRDQEVLNLLGDNRAWLTVVDGKPTFVVNEDWLSQAIADALGEGAAEKNNVPTDEEN